jgi:hypothetical protein
MPSRVSVSIAKPCCSHAAPSQCGGDPRLWRRQ